MEEADEEHLAAAPAASVSDAAANADTLVAASAAIDVPPSPLLAERRASEAGSAVLDAGADSDTTSEAASQPTHSAASSPGAAVLDAAQLSASVEAASFADMRRLKVALASAVMRADRLTAQLNEERRERVTVERSAQELEDLVVRLKMQLQGTQDTADAVGAASQRQMPGQPATARPGAAPTAAEGHSAATAPATETLNPLTAGALRVWSRRDAGPRNSQLAQCRPPRGAHWWQLHRAEPLVHNRCARAQTVALAARLADEYAPCPVQSPSPPKHRSASVAVNATAGTLQPRSKLCASSPTMRCSPVRRATCTGGSCGPAAGQGTEAADHARATGGGGGGCNGCQWLLVRHAAQDEHQHQRDRAAGGVEDALVQSGGRRAVLPRQREGARRAQLACAFAHRRSAIAHPTVRAQAAPKGVLSLFDPGVTLERPDVRTFVVCMGTRKRARCPPAHTLAMR